jgi:hypothetical protein
MAEKRPFFNGNRVPVRSVTPLPRPSAPMSATSRQIRSLYTRDRLILLSFAGGHHPENDPFNHSWSASEGAVDGAGLKSAGILGSAAWLVHD